MIPDDFLKKAIAQVTLTTSTSAEYCYKMPIIDFLDFYKDLADESQRMRHEKGG